MLNLIKKLREKILFRLFYWAIRIGMGLTFIASGIRKLPGVEFTALPITNPVGAFFNAMHEAGFYWNCIGYFQIVIGLLIFINRFVVISSILMMPVTINIFLVSISLQMRGTPVITTLMVCGNIFLMLWHYENYISILQKPNSKSVRLPLTKK